MRIAILGGGVGGHLVARALQGDHEVLLIEPRAHLVIPIAMPRMMVEPAVGERALIPYADFLPQVEHIRGRAVALHPDRVIVEQDGGRSTVHADAFVLATGASYPGDEPALFPQALDPHQRIQAAIAFRVRLVAAKRVLILGGGPVGIEVAGELAEDLPDLEVTLIDPGERLLPGTPARAGRLAHDWLEAHGVRVILGDSVPLPAAARGGPWSGRSHLGEALDVDVAMAFYGYRPRLGYLDPLGDGVLDEAGRVRTRPSLQIHGHDHILAVGDVTDLPERKLAMYAAKHAAVAVDTLRALAAGQAPTRTYTAATGDRTMLVTLGRRDGICCLPGIGAVRVAILARRLKSADVMIGKYRARIGLRR